MAQPRLPKKYLIELAKVAHDMPAFEDALLKLEADVPSVAEAAKAYWRGSSPFNWLSYQLREPFYKIDQLSITYYNETVTFFKDGSPSQSNKATTEVEEEMTKTTVEEVMTYVEGALKAISKDSYSSLSENVSQVEAKAKAKVDKAEAAFSEEQKKRKEMENTLAPMQKKLVELSSAPASATKQSYKGDGTIPSGEVVMTPVSKVFPTIKWDVDFDVPVWAWDGDHPHVPFADPKYVFREKEVRAVLYSIMYNERLYIQGHTGSGKTTLVEQVAAALNYPFKVVNFDSELSRMDLIGRETLTQVGGSTVSKFVDGILPQAVSSPVILCADEIDFVRPDVAYVLQRVLEGNALTITEDGGRIVNPDPNFRLIATGNTVGQGDEAGMYQGARPQSLAMLDRFTNWLYVPYLDTTQRKNLIESVAPALAPSTVNKLNQYVEEHLRAFTTDKTVLQPISPRGYMSVALAASRMMLTTKGTQEENLKAALDQTVLNRASESDRAVLNELVQRVL